MSFSMVNCDIGDHGVLLVLMPELAWRLGVTELGHENLTRPVMSVRFHPDRTVG
jgi:hypothetical protein